MEVIDYNVAPVSRAEKFSIFFTWSKQNFSIFCHVNWKKNIVCSNANQMNQPIMVNGRGPSDA